ncbi:SDR family NAD(P)-dependent oxidoreductase [Frateuria aurantia]
MSEAPRHVVITGASAGLGQALALAYAGPEAVLGLVGRNAERLAVTAELCRQRGAIVLLGRFDVATEASALAEWLRAFDQAHPIDLLIANAGVASTLVDDRDWEDLARSRSVLDTNLYGTLHTVMPVVPWMRARKHGQIAMISSLAAFRGMAISPAYCASKSALRAWGDSVRPLLAKDDVGLSLIYPGFVKTAMSDVFPGDKPQLWSPERAATLIQRKLQAGADEIMFPRLLAEGIRWLNMLPPRLADWILERLSLAPAKSL